MTRNKLLTACAIVSLTLGLSACSSDDGPVTMMPGAQMEVDKVILTDTTITLPAGLDLDDETVTAAKGEPVTIEDVGDFECASATCTVVVADNVITVTGDIKVVSLADDLPADVLAALTDAFEEVVELTPLEAAKTAAADEAAAAMAAAVTAGEAVAAADTARENTATMQTNETSSGHAEMALYYATKAQAAYMTAKTASDAAAAATDVTTAVEARVAAERAMAEAVDAEAKATIHAGLAMAAVDNELFIDGTVKTVAGTMIDAEAKNSVVSTDRNTVETGLLKSLNPVHAAAMIATEGTLGTPAVPGDTTVYVAPVAGAAGRPLTIGKTVDSPDDLARLMIVTQYAGSKTVKVFATDDEDGPASSKADTIQTGGFGPDNAEEEDVFVDLKPVGMYYLAGDAATLTAGVDLAVAADAEPEQVYSYDATPGDDDDALTYVVLKSKLEDGGVTTYTYSVAGIHVVIERDGNPATDMDLTEVRAKIAEATDYAHIHFGVWAGLGAAANDGSQNIADLGIGFVQSIGGGLTGADMPNGGIANYNGDWVAAVREADDDGDGAISLVSGPATLTADFSKGDITADLTDLATLKGDIAGNTFSGTEATVGTDNVYNLTGGEDNFTGTFGGGFYGAKAAEAGGIFDFTSTDKENGEFRGAFGGAK